MLHTAKVIFTIIGRAGLKSFKLNEVKRKQQYIEDFHERNQFTQLQPKLWARNILNTAGVKVNVHGELPYYKEPVLYVANHEGNFDIPVLISTILQPFGFVSKQEVEKIPFLKDWMDLMHCIYIDRKDRRSGVKMLKSAIQNLNDGYSILIFPEGTRSKGEGIQEFKAGALKMAQKAKVNIVPVVIKGTSEIMEKNDHNKIKQGIVQVKMLEPIEPSIFKKQSLQDVTTMIERKIKTQYEKL